MVRRRSVTLAICLATAVTALHAQAPAAAPAVAKFIRINVPQVLLTHVRVIDGTGAAPLEDQSILIENGKIASISKGPSTPAQAEVLDLHGYTVIPGLVGMHDHMYYIARPNFDAHGNSEPPLIVPQMAFSAPRMYLAAGVTTLRTTGSVEPYTDLNLRREIDAGHLPGPHIDVTGPYLEGPDSALHADAPPPRRRRRPPHRRASGPTRESPVQGLHEHHPRRAESRHRRGA